MTTSRIKQAFAFLEDSKLDCFLVTEINHVRYLSGFSGSNGMALLAPPKVYFFTDFRYVTQSRREVKNCQIVPAERGLIDELPKLPLFSRKKLRMGVEASHVSIKFQNRLKELLPSVTFESTENVIESLMARKDQDEIRRIKKAVKITEQALREVLKDLKPGVQEKDIALELDYKMRRLGADRAAFDIIVASGQRSSMPHAVASNRKLRKGDLITIDLGCYYEGYASDITRTVVLGKANSKQKKIYGIVLNAQKAALKAVKPGLACNRLDSVAREMIVKAGYGDYFGHGLGHGIGMLVHDGPVLGPRSTDVLALGMVVTIEPGIYIPNWGGVRIEDDVVVTANGGQILSKFPKDLLEI